MTLFLNILFFVIGLVLLIKGADFFVSGASTVAKKLKVSPFIIGITAVSLGTSLPELAISITSAIKGSVDLSISNIVGSNISNLCLILGLSALFGKIQLQKSTKKFDLPFLFLVTFLLLLFSADKILGGFENIISRTESIIFILLLIYYIYIQIKKSKKSLNYKEDFNIIDNNLQLNDTQVNDVKEINLQENDELNNDLLEIDAKNASKNPKRNKELKIWQIILYIICGLGAVVFGSECVASTAKYLALSAGMSEVLVGLTIVAIGTSLPELATSVMAAKKGETELAFGNIIGSNIANIILILGIVGLINPINITNIILIDMVILFVITIIFMLLCRKKKNIGKLQGLILLSIYILYIIFIIVSNYCFNFD